MTAPTGSTALRIIAGLRSAIRADTRETEAATRNLAKREAEIRKREAETRKDR